MNERDSVIHLLSARRSSQSAPHLSDLPPWQHAKTVDIAPEEAALVKSMWASLNATVATSYISRSPPELLGPCNSSCALEYWAKYGGTGTEAAAPECGVPGCRP